MSGKKKFEITSKEEDHSKWYQELLTRSGMIDYTDVSGCYVLKPWAVRIWNIIKNTLNSNLGAFGVDEIYFPMLVSESNLKREAEHLDDFAPEVAWIQAGDDSSKERERFAIRPTSETIIYPHFANWLKETGEYPKINQWCNILRWESKDCTPFIRSREFLWQEGHTCHKTKEDAISEMNLVLGVYAEMYFDLGVYTIEGIKTRSETFPGAEITSTIEAYLSESGKGIQSATSHYLGTRFSKMFDIKDSDGNYAHQNSWGFTTRSIGICAMAHSDDKGLVLPPFVAPIQVVIVPCGITTKTPDTVRNDIESRIYNLANRIGSVGIRCSVDLSKDTPGMKFNKWELKGVPLRLELGPRDLDKDVLTLAYRHTQTRQTRTLSKIEVDPSIILSELDDIQSELYQTSRIKTLESISLIDGDPIDDHTKADIAEAVRSKRLCLIELPSQDEAEIERELKQYCTKNGVNSTKVLCIPESIDLTEYFKLDESMRYGLFGRSF